jgi:hypothetical protein
MRAEAVRTEAVLGPDIVVDGRGEAEHEPIFKCLQHEVSRLASRASRRFLGAQSSSQGEYHDRPFLMK